MKQGKRLATALLAAGFAIGVALFALAVVAPHFGLGTRENFVLYRRLGWSRAHTAALGAGLLLVAAASGVAMLMHRQKLSPAGALANTIAGRGVSILHHVLAYYEMGPRSPPNPVPRRDVGLLLGLAAILQTVYLVAIPLTFECDAASYYSFARFIVGAGGGYSYVRGPGYPLFLILTGDLWPKTFLFTLLVQAAFGVVIPLIFYRCLWGLGRVPALGGALLLIASTIPFTAAKLVLTEQLYTLLVLLAIMCLALYHDGRNPRSIYAFALCALAAMFTRWESQVLVAIGFVAIFVLAYRRPRQIRHAILAAAISISIIGGYSVARALLISPSLLGTLQNGTGAQLFWRMHAMNESAFSAREPSLSRTPKEAEESARYPQFISGSNGPASARLRLMVRDYIRDHPESYRSLKEPLSLLPEDSGGPHGWIYQEAFGRFEGSPDALTDNIFSASHDLATESYIYYVNGIAQQELGIAAADRLLRDVAIEAIRANPLMPLTVMFIDVPFQETGFTLYGLDRVIRDPASARSWQAFFPFREPFAFANVGFDAGGCASATLPARMMAEYRLDQRLHSNLLSEPAVMLGGFLRNLIRPIIGVTILFGWWVSFFSRRRILDLAVLASAVALIVASGSLTGVVANFRYEYAIFPLDLLVAVAIASEVGQRLRSFAVRRRRSVSA